jgi:lipopolysaccharide/colanic/teichoic acid biosynthesis glycosyltransferase
MANSPLRNPSATAMSVRGEDSDLEILGSSTFLKMLVLERKRSERSQRRFVLMLLKPDNFHLRGDSKRMLVLIFSALYNATRKTDIKGWYDRDRTIGVIFTEIGDTDAKSVIETLSKRVRQALYEATGGQFNEFCLFFRIFPEEGSTEAPPPPVDRLLYPDVVQNSAVGTMKLGLKRMMDLAGSLFGLILCAPLLFTIAVLIKLTSKGPILFRQERIGHYGKPFTFLKFRSMYVNNDHAVHERYVTRFISANNHQMVSGPREAVTYKLTRDSRITKIGRFLRRASLDELPQLINVLKGDMSLVGPRPPISYEIAAYRPWHKNRLIVVKPGITGMWQVGGRSRVTFDDMVRLDLKYAASWSLWLDLTILLQTPWAVISGQGAY